MRARGFLGAAAVVAGLAGGLAATAPAAFAGVATCPPAIAAGSRVLGNLSVTGTCRLTNVTVLGSVTVQSGSALELNSSTVLGNVVVQPGAELDSGAILFNGDPSGMPSRVHGSVLASSPDDLDFDGGSIGGTLTFTGAASSRPTVCGVAIGVLRVSSFTGNGGLVIGDPDNDATSLCVGNTIGSVSIVKSPGVEIDGNTISGGVQIVGSSVAFDENSVRGGVICSAGSGLVDFGDNTISGFNNCAVTPT